MNFTQIRSATIKVTYAGKTFLVDPWFAKKGELGFLGHGPLADYKPGRAEQEEWPCPLVDLPMSNEEVLENVDAYIVTHIHPDHVDVNFQTGTLGDPLDKSVPLYVQNDADKMAFEASGFKEIKVLSELEENQIKMTKTECRHGMIVPAGDAMGIVFQAENEPTLYLVGDTVMYEAVEKALLTYKPDVIIVNACAAVCLGMGRLIMNDEDIMKIHQILPDATIIASHMDTVSHLSLDRSELKRKMAGFGIEKNVLIPDDGESYTF